MNISDQAEISRVYQPLFEITHSIVLRWDAKGKIKYVNEYGAQFFGYQVSELVGKSVMILVPEKDTRGSDLTQLANDILHNPQNYINYVNDNVKKNGEIVHVAWTNKAIISDNHLPDEIVAIGNDITKQIWTENELLKANQKLAETNQQLIANNELINNLLYIAAHDLKGPIGNFKLIFDLIDFSNNDTEKLELLPRIRNTYHQLDKVINGLNCILKLQNVENHAKEIHLQEMLEDLLTNEFSESVLKYGKFISCDFSQAPTIVYVELFLTSILKNLISNAIKYKKEGTKPEIKIKSKRFKGFVIIEIEDQGIGIDLNIHGSSLFTPFKRFTKQADGTGIGLYLIKDMISKNGGDIKTQSTPGKGTKFICYFKEYTLSSEASL